MTGESSGAVPGSEPVPESLSDADVSSAEAEAARRRRRAEVFGEVLPDSTRDDRDEDSGRGSAGNPGDSASDEWLRRNVPPHHG